MEKNPTQNSGEILLAKILLNLDFLDFPVSGGEHLYF